MRHSQDIDEVCSYWKFLGRKSGNLHDLRGKESGFCPLSSLGDDVFQSLEIWHPISILSSTMDQISLTFGSRCCSSSSLNSHESVIFISQNILHRLGSIKLLTFENLQSQMNASFFFKIKSHLSLLSTIHPQPSFPDIPTDTKKHRSIRPRASIATGVSVSLNILIFYLENKRSNRCYVPFHLIFQRSNKAKAPQRSLISSSHWLSLPSQ
jgi:hypothetical protein